MFRGIMTTVIFIVMASTGACNSVILHGDNGNLSSPNYPSDYDNNTYLVYEIRLQSTGPLQVRLDYIVDLEEGNSFVQECYDKLQIPENSWQLCGTVNGSVYLSLQSNTFQIEFTTDSSITKTGFFITYSLLQGDCNATVDLLLKDERKPQWVLMPITDMMTRQSVVLSVRCCLALRIRLTTLPDPYATDIKQLHITEVDRRPTSNILTCSAATGGCSRTTVQPNATRDSDMVHCCEFSSFWINWTSTTVAVGRGATVGSNLILSEEATFSMDVRFFFLLARSHARLVASFDAPFPDSYCHPAVSMPPLPARCTQEDSTTGIADWTTNLSSITQPSVSETSSLRPTSTTVKDRTTAPSQVPKYSREHRSCQCLKDMVRKANATSQTLREERLELEQKKTEMAETIKKDLTLQKSNVSATVRRRTTAEDKRDSSTYVGFVVSLVCFSPLVFIISCDCLALIANLHKGIKALLR